MGLKKKIAGKRGKALRGKHAGRPAAAAPKPEKVASVSGKGPHFVGLDLGTVRSSIVTSWDARAYEESVVGWPKDVISAKTLGVGVMIGQEALNNRLALEIVYPLDHGVIREGAPRCEEAANILVKHLIDSTNPPEGDIYCVVGAPAQGVKPYKKLLMRMLRQYFANVLVIPEPFSVAYGLDMLQNCLVVDIGGGTSDICRLSGSIPKVEDLRSISMAGNYVDDQLLRLLSDKFPETLFTRAIVKRIKEEYAEITDREQSVIVELAVNGKHLAHEVGPELQRATSIILSDIMNGIRDEIATFDPDFQEKVRNNIILAGGMSQIPGLGEYIQNSLSDMGPSRVSVVEDPIFLGTEGALKFGMDIPPEYWEEMERMLH
ncbi:MAG: rod shape-determining protein [Nitrospinae bacterium]|nr:rod shape-determining protein [Nitrospinota bacterium]